MKYSRNSQRKQTTQNRDYLADVEVQLRDRQGVPSGSLAFSKRESENRADGNTSNLMEKILARDNMIKAYQRVKANKGSHGIDGMSVDELRDFLIEHWLNIKQKLLEGNYYPSPVRRVEIPKPDGGVRKLGIPTVLDRLIQQAIAQELTKIYDPTSVSYTHLVPFMGSPVNMEIMNRYEVDSGMDAILSIDTTKGNRVINHKGFAISPTVKEGYILRISEDLLEVMSIVTGKLPVTFPVTIQDITPVSYTHLDVYKRQEGRSGILDVVKPRALESGDTVAVVAPSGPCLLYTSRCV